MTVEIVTRLWLIGTGILAVAFVIALVLLRGFVSKLNIEEQAGQLITFPPLRALVEYWKEHEWVFSLLFVITMVAYAWWAFLTVWILIGGVSKSADDANRIWAGLAFQVCSSIGLALLILILTDYAGKRYLSKSLEIRMQDLERSLAHKGKIAEIVERFGIYCLPKIMASSTDSKEIKAACGPQFDEIFNERHKNASHIRVVSTHGANWLLPPPPSMAADSPFDLLNKRKVSVQVVIYSPLLHYLRSVSKQVDLTEFKEWMDGNISPLSRATGSKLLADHIEFSDALRVHHTERHTTVWVSPRDLPSSFFVVDEVACYSGFPMWTRKHQDAIAVTIHSGKSSVFKSQMVKMFSAEFDNIQAQCISFEDYFKTHEKLIRGAVAHANTHA